MAQHGIELRTLKQCFEFLEWLNGKAPKHKVVTAFVQKLRPYFPQMHRYKSALQNEFFKFLRNVSTLRNKLSSNPVTTPGTYEGKTKDENTILDALLECTPKFLAALSFIQYHVDDAFSNVGGGDWASQSPKSRDFQTFLTNGNNIIRGGFDEMELSDVQGKDLVKHLREILNKDGSRGTTVNDHFRNVILTTLGKSLDAVNTGNVVFLLLLFCELVMDDPSGDNYKSAMEKGIGTKTICWKDLKNHCKILSEHIDKLKGAGFSATGRGMRPRERVKFATEAADWFRANLPSTEKVLKGMIPQSIHSHSTELHPFAKDHLYPNGFIFDGSKPNVLKSGLPRDWTLKLQKFHQLGENLMKLKSILDGYECGAAPMLTNARAVAPAATKTEAAKPVVTKAEAAKPTATKTKATKTEAVKPSATRNADTSNQGKKAEGTPNQRTAPNVRTTSSSLGPHSDSSTVSGADVAKGQPGAKGDQGAKGPPDTGSTKSSTLRGAGNPQQPPPQLPPVPPPSTPAATSPAGPTSDGGGRPNDSGARSQKPVASQTPAQPHSPSVQPSGASSSGVPALGDGQTTSSGADQQNGKSKDSPGGSPQNANLASPLSPAKPQPSSAPPPGSPSSSVPAPSNGPGPGDQASTSSTTQQSDPSTSQSSTSATTTASTGSGAGSGGGSGGKGKVDPELDERLKAYKTILKEKRDRDEKNMETILNKFNETFEQIEQKKIQQQMKNNLRKQLLANLRSADLLQNQNVFGYTGGRVDSGRDYYDPGGNQSRREMQPISALDGHVAVNAPPDPKFSSSSIPVSSAIGHPLPDRLRASRLNEGLVKANEALKRIYAQNEFQRRNSEFIGAPPADSTGIPKTIGPNVFNLNGIPTGNSMKLPKPLMKSPRYATKIMPSPEVPDFVGEGIPDPTRGHRLPPLPPIAKRSGIPAPTNSNPLINIQIEDQTIANIPDVEGSPIENKSTHIPTVYIPQDSAFETFVPSEPTGDPIPDPKTKAPRKSLTPVEVDAHPGVMIDEPICQLYSPALVTKKIPHTDYNILPPRTVRDMLCWLSDLPHALGYTDLTNHIINLFEGSELIETFPESISSEDVTEALSETCGHASSVLAGIQEPVPIDLNKLHYERYGAPLMYYSEDPYTLLCQLLSYVYATYHQLLFLRTQCRRDTYQGGWRDCQYGRNVLASESWQCRNDPVDPMKLQSHGCDPSPLQGFLTDQSVLPTYWYQRYDVCRRSRIKMGFVAKGFRDDSKHGFYIYNLLTGACYNNVDPLEKLCKYLVCLTKRTPRTTGELVSCFHHFGIELYGYGQMKLSKLGDSLSTPHADCPDWDHLGRHDLQAVQGIRGSESLNSISNHNHDKEHPRTLSTLVGCGSDPTTCQPRMSPITYRAYALYSQSFAHTYLSWTVYLPDLLWESLQKLHYELKKHDYAKCASLHQCSDALPLLYTHGITPPEGKSRSSITCSEIITKLKEIVNGGPIASLMTAMDDFLYNIREPFIFTLVALWSTALLVLANTMLYRLDVLYIRSHLIRTKASHLIDVKALLTKGRKMLSLYKDVDYFDDDYMSKFGVQL